jgi:hypothetical protein
VKVEMSGMPGSPYEIIIKGGAAYVNFFENAVEIPEGEQPKWTCDTYQLAVKNRLGLEASIQANYEKWLAAAKAKEAIPQPLTEGERIALVEGAVLELILGGAV